MFSILKSWRKKKINWVFPEDFGQKAFMFARLKEYADTECLFENSTAFSRNIHIVVWNLYIITPASASGFQLTSKVQNQYFLDYKLQILETKWQNTQFAGMLLFYSQNKELCLSKQRT